MRNLVIVTAVLVLAHSAARAGDGDRLELIGSIDDAVRLIATQLDAVDADNSKDIDDVLAVASHVRDLVARLAPIKGSDTRANEIAAHYIAYVDAFVAVATQLGEMKVREHRADGFVERCNKDSAGLHALIQRVQTHPDPMRDLPKLVARGQALGVNWTGELAKLAAIDHEIAAATAMTELALTDSYWLTVSTKVARASKDIAERWATRYLDANAACEQLARGEQHIDLAPLIDNLRQRTAQTRAVVLQLVRDYNAWLWALRALRVSASAARVAMRDAICKATDDELDDRARNVADSVARDLADAVEAVLDTAAELRTRTGDRAVIAPAKMLDGLRGNLAFTTKLKLDEIAGRNSPKLLALLTTIRHRRDAAAQAARCVYRNVDLAASDCGSTEQPNNACRIACVRIANATCSLIELAPDNEVAISAAGARGVLHINGMHAWYARDKKSLLATYPALHACENADQSDFDVISDVATYDACAKISAADFGEVLPEITPDLSEPTP